MNKILYITFYTVGVYEKVFNQYLRPSLEKRKLPYYAFKKENFKNWRKNTLWKASVILEALEKFKEDLVFIDADATIEKFPKLFYEIPSNCDLAIHYLDWFLHWRNEKGKSLRELLTGTMFIRNNDKMKKIVKEWNELNKKTPDIMEQKILQNLLDKKKEILVYHLPVDYVVIPKQNGTIPPYIKNIVILHHQFSRKIKKGIEKL